MTARFRLMLFTLFLLPCLCSGQASEQAHPVDIDVEHSSMTVHVQRSGMFAFAADNHEIRAPISRGKLDEAAGSIQFEIETAKMQVLDPKMDPTKRAQVQEKMLGPDVLDASHYQLIQFTSTSVLSEKIGHWSVTGSLKLHGQSHSVTVPVSAPAAEVTLAGARPKIRHYHGTAILKQTDFGIKPISIAGGTVKVKDEVKIEFEIVTR